MPTPSKPYAVLVAEKKSNRTKRELKARKEAEEALLTGSKIKERPEVKENKNAHKEFLRVTKMLSNIGKNDAIYEPIINRYCLIQAECIQIDEDREKTKAMIERLEKNIEDVLSEIEDPEARADHLNSFSKSIEKLYKLLIAYDRQIQTKRKMLFDIEKENIMTIAAALRNVPKKEKEKENPLLRALNGN